MKIGGKTIPKLTEDVFVIVREGENGEELHFPFIIKPVDPVKFNEDYPEPTPPTKLTPQGTVPNKEDASYLGQMQERGELFMPWLVINAIRDTPDLEWEKVRYGDVDTWKYYKDDLLEAMSATEFTSLLAKIVTVQGLDSAKMEAARKAFLAGRGKAV